MAPGGKDDVEQSEKYSYTWADDDSDSESEFVGLTVKNPAKLEKLKNKKTDLIAKFGYDVGRVSEGKPVLNIVFIGLHGSGKSSTINTCIAAFSDTKYQEFALTGTYNDGKQYTYQVQSFKKERYIPHRKHICMPTFIDLGGFDDEDSDISEELLRILLFGCLPEGETLLEAREYATLNGLNGLQNKYKQNKDELKVDRIIFVTSATQNIPEKFIRRVSAAAHPSGGKSARSKKVIPMFGVMCKVDKVDVNDEEFKEKEKKFIGCLGLTGSEHRYTRLVNYCNDVDQDKKRMDAVFPELDVPALKFLRQVCASSYEITGPAANLKYEDTLEKPEVPDTTEDEQVNKPAVRPTPPPSPLNNDAVTLLFTYLLKGIIIAIFIFLLMAPPIKEEQLKTICSEYETTRQTSNLNLNIPDLKTLCDNKVKITNPSLILPLITFVTVMVIIDHSVPIIVQKIVTRMQAQ